jgi:antitoxin ParD1/3/4
MGTMNVSLPDDLTEFVKTETAEGGYASQSDVVREALRRLRDQKEKRTTLLRLLAEADADVAAGRVEPFTKEVIADIAARARARAKSKELR